MPVNTRPAALLVKIVITFSVLGSFVAFSLPARADENVMVLLKEYVDCLNQSQGKVTRQLVEQSLSRCTHAEQRYIKAFPPELRADVAERLDAEKAKFVEEYLGRR